MIDGVRFNPFKLQRRSFLRKITFIFFFFYNITSANSNIVSKLPVLYLRQLHGICVYNDQTTDENLILTRLYTRLSHDPHMYVYVRIC